MRELVLTGLREYWPQDEENAVYLGPWCFANNHKYRFWEQKNFTLAASPWETPQKILEASRYIDALIERIIPALALRLNSYHNVDYSPRFWKLYLSVWLTHWLGQCYDRYLRLQYFDKRASELFTVNLLPQQAKRHNFKDYMTKILESHYYNLALFSEIIRLCKFQSFVPKLSDRPAEDAAGSGKQKPGLGDIKTNIRKLAKDFLRQTRNQILNSLETSLHLGDIYGMSFMDKLYLYLSYAPSYFSFFKSKPADKIHHQADRRDEFIKQAFLFEAQNEFEEIIEKMLLPYMPEDFLSLRLHKKPAEKNRTIWIGMDIYTKALSVADTCEGGGQWLSCQHGGGYGQSFAFPLGKIEYETSDGFITWGWNYKHVYASNFYPLPSPKLSKLPKHNQRQDQLMLVGAMHPPYYYRLHSYALPEQQCAYIESRKALLTKLLPHIRGKVKYKPYFYAYGIKEIEFLQELLSSKQWLLKRGGPVFYKGTKLVVIDYLSTAMLETLSMNAPTILFWSPAHFPVTSEAQIYFDKLRAAGILFDTPEEASTKINAIWEDVQGWWRQPEVQKAKDEFCWQFARTSKNWRKEWLDFLKGLHASVSE